MKGTVFWGVSFVLLFSLAIPVPVVRADDTMLQNLDRIEPLVEVIEAELTDLSVGKSENDPVVSPVLVMSSDIANTVVVTQVITGMLNQASHELIEIHNATDSDIDVTGWCVRYASANGASFSKVIGCFMPATNQVGQRVLLSARSFSLFASAEFVAAYSTPDTPFGVNNVFSSGLAGAAGRIAIFSADGMLVDGVAWKDTASSTTVTLVEGSPALAGTIIERRILEGGQFQDTDNNTDDFILGTLRSEYRYAQFVEACDGCLNVAGLWPFVPGGLCRDAIAGTCRDVPPEPINTCEGVVIAEIAANVTDQFIELHNPTGESIELGGCIVQTNRGLAMHTIPNQSLVADARVVIYIADSDLVLTKTTTGTVYLLSSDAQLEVDSVVYSNLTKDTSWALIDSGWYQTYDITPGKENVYAQYAPCDEGYWRNLETGRCNKIVEPVTLVDCGEGRERNPETGRCRNIPTASQLAPCKEGQYRSEETNRCRSIAAAASALKPCADDQFRNPETNRCKKIASTDDLTDCGEGRERNPVTNRCRNVAVLAASTSGGDVQSEIVEGDNSPFSWLLIGVAATGVVGYAVWEWRSELGKAYKNVASRLKSSKDTKPKS